MSEKCASPGAEWRHRGAVAASVVLGLVFLVAAFTKFDYLRPLERDIMGFLRLRDENSPLGVQALARLLLGVEIATGVGLILPFWRRRLFLPLAMLMLVGFSIYLLTLDPAKENCGCFGLWLKMGPRASLLKNLIMLPICAAAFRYQRRETSGRRWLWLPPVVLAASAAAVFVLRPPQRPLPPPPLPFAAFPAFPEAPKPLGEGVSILAFFSATCDHCKAASKTLLELQSVAAAYMVFYEAENDIAEFQASTDTYGVPWVRLDPTVFFEHIGEAPPRVYILDRGKVVRFWDEKAPVEELRQTLGPLLAPRGP